MTTKTITKPVYEINFTDEERKICCDFCEIVADIQSEIVTHGLPVDTDLEFGQVEKSVTQLCRSPMVLAMLIDRYGRLKFTGYCGNEEESENE